MRPGWKHGDLGIGLFIGDEGGYTSVATAVALLVSISLVFTVTSVEWTVSRSADVQPVADACAMAGQNTIAAYYTVAQVLDACVLSMGLTGEGGLDRFGHPQCAPNVCAQRCKRAEARREGAPVCHYCEFRIVCHGECGVRYVARGRCAAVFFSALFSPPTAPAGSVLFHLQRNRKYGKTVLSFPAHRRKALLL